MVVLFVDVPKIALDPDTFDRVAVPINRCMPSWARMILAVGIRPAASDWDALQAAMESAYAAGGIDGLAGYLQSLEG
jgi:hypothetical protein